jgi:NRAMP (natural resistance-associated macrophage protein)-like metal ion transporter
MMQATSDTYEEIRGALGTLRAGDMTSRGGWSQRLRTLLAILGPGLIVMVGDNDAGAFSTYAQAGQNYGTTLLWTLGLLVPVLYVNQEMVLRLGTVTGVGHARLILQRFGKFWGAFSVIDLFILNALTLVTEFVGISIGLDILGVPKVLGVVAAAALVMAAAGTGDFRRFERFALILVFGSVLLLPIFLMTRPPVAEIAHDFLVPQLPPRAHVADVMLLIIAIVGTTVAPWQLFFQQSYIIDKRIGMRFINYERLDLVIGIAIVVFGAVAMIAFCAHAFAGTPEFGQFTDAGGIALGLDRFHGTRLPGVLFALALIDASIIGAAAVSLSSAYAVGDLMKMRQTLHGSYCCLIAVAAALVLVPNMPLGLLTNAVQTLAGVLLPSASVFLLLLCNDRELLGPWANSFKLNVFTSLVVGVLVLLSLILTAAVLFPDISGAAIGWILGGGALIGAGAVAIVALRGNRAKAREPRACEAHAGEWRGDPASWRAPRLEDVGAIRLTPMRRLSMLVLRGYLVIAVIMVIVRVAQTAMA